MTTQADAREEWLRANRRMTDAALQVARWVELHGANLPASLRPLMDEYVAARAVVMDRIVADQAPATLERVPDEEAPPLRHLRVVR